MNCPPEVRLHFTIKTIQGYAGIEDARKHNSEIQLISRQLPQYRHIGPTSQPIETVKSQSLKCKATKKKKKEANILTQEGIPAR